MSLREAMSASAGRSHPRHLVNLRDVGGADPALRRGMLLRGDAPHSQDEHVYADVSWPPATVVDLRDDREKNEPHPLSDNGRVISLPLTDGATSASLDVAPTSLGALYRAMLEGRSAETLVEAMHVLALADGPVLVHCTAGKDRTGIVVALALCLLGVPRSAIIADYRRTDAAMPRVISRIPITLAGGVADASWTLPPEFSRAPAHAIEEFLDALDAHPGGAEGWFQSRGGDTLIVDALRTRMRTTPGRSAREHSKTG